MGHKNPRIRNDVARQLQKYREAVREIMPGKADAIAAKVDEVLGVKREPMRGSEVLITIKK
jgi:hypothetical protein